MKMSIGFLILFLCIGLAITTEGQKKEIKIEYEKYTLPNGLNVILHADKSDPIAAVYVVYHVGSAREEAGKTGFAHLFEHLRFNDHRIYRRDSGSRNCKQPEPQTLTVQPTRIELIISKSFRKMRLKWPSGWNPTEWVSC